MTTLTALARPLWIAALGGALLLDPVAAQTRATKDKDLGALAKALGEYVQARIDRKKIMEAEQGISEEFEKLAKKLKDLPDQDLLASPQDLGAAIWLSYDYGAQRLKTGKPELFEYKGGPFASEGVEPLEYVLWLPPSYKIKDTSSAMPLVISLPDIGEDPKQHLIERWESAEIRDAYVIAVPKMPADKDQWSQQEGIRNVLVTMGQVCEKVGVDFDRVFLAGRGHGVQAALSIASLFPYRFAGVIGRAGTAGTTKPHNFKHLPVLFTGGDQAATEFEKAADGLGYKNLVKIDVEGKESEVLAWMNGQRRVSYPTEVDLYPGEPSPNRSFWLAVKPGAANKDAKIGGTIDRDKNQITITAEGVREAQVYLSDGLLDLSREVTIVANGQTTTEKVGRSRKAFLDWLYAAVVDPGQVYVVMVPVSLPATSDGAK